MATNIIYDRAATERFALGMLRMAREQAASSAPDGQDSRYLWLLETQQILVTSKEHTTSLPVALSYRHFQELSVRWTMLRDSYSMQPGGFGIYNSEDRAMLLLAERISHCIKEDCGYANPTMPFGLVRKHVVLLLNAELHFEQHIGSEKDYVDIAWAISVVLSPSEEWSPHSLVRCKKVEQA